MKFLKPFFAANAGRCIIAPLAALLITSTISAKADGPDGAKLYVDNNCVACHQADGAGVANTFPALKGNPLLAGDADILIKILILGPVKVLPPDSPKYSGQMPPLTLSDAKIAALVTYIRNKFGNGAAAVDEDEVAKVRAALPQ